MRIQIMMLLLSAAALQSCANRADNCADMTTSQEATTTEATATPSTTAPLVTTPAIAATEPTEETKATTHSAKQRKSSKGDVYYVNTESKNTPGFKASYQVHREMYTNENKQAQNRVAATNRYATAQPINYQRIKVQKGNMHGVYDLPGDDYRGEEVKSHDGVAKNIERNINYLDFTSSKVPNDGGDFDR